MKTSKEQEFVIREITNNTQKGTVHLIQACAGSGKTSVLTEIFSKFLEEGRYKMPPPFDSKGSRNKSFWKNTEAMILAFNNSAANANFADIGLPGITFNALGNSILYSSLREEGIRMNGTPRYKPQNKELGIYSNNTSCNKFERMKLVNLYRLCIANALFPIEEEHESISRLALDNAIEMKGLWDDFYQGAKACLEHKSVSFIDQESWILHPVAVYEAFRSDLGILAVDEYQDVTWNRLYAILILSGIIPSYLKQKWDFYWNRCGIDHPLLDSNRDVLKGTLDSMEDEAHNPLILVGDPRQAIFGWNGAVSDIFDQTKEIFANSNMREYNLTTSHRITQSAAAYIRENLPDRFEIFATERSGKLEYINSEQIFKLADSDTVILSRTLAPLITIGTRLFAVHNKKVSIRGNDIADILADVLKQSAITLLIKRDIPKEGVSKSNKKYYTEDQIKSLSIEEIKVSIFSYLDEKIESSRSNSSKSHFLDLRDIWSSLFQGRFSQEKVSSYNDITDILELISTLCNEHAKKFEGTVLSTIDRYKGSGSKKVILLTQELPHRLSSSPEDFIQESNRVNVALTRSLEDLYLVGDIDFGLLI